ncbi:MAG: hypothetical protein GY851_27410 [bacterium]|nr:hypothetical protein [bacterium]
MTRRREEEKRRRQRTGGGVERPADCIGTCITCIPDCPVHEEERKRRREAEGKGGDEAPAVGDG